jgi:hypothetical protein
LNSQTVQQQSPCYINQTEAQNFHDCDQRKVISAEADHALEDQQDSYHDEVPSSDWKFSSKESNRCEEIDIFISHGQEHTTNEGSSRLHNNIRCNDLSPSNVRETDSFIRSSDVVLINASAGENSKGNDNSSYLFAYWSHYI